MRELLFIALVLACPVMMVLMMRGGHVHGGHAGDGVGYHEGDAKGVSTQDLRRSATSWTGRSRNASNRGSDFCAAGCPDQFERDQASALIPSGGIADKES
jgi:hypothetical protein